MADVGKMFKEAVEVGDYSASEDILDDCFSDGTLRDVISVVELKVENERSSSLAFRDHVFSYVNLEGVYFALQIPSHELLHMLRGANTREDVTNDAFELVVTLSEMRDPTMKVTEVDIESVRDTAFAVLVPWVLARRLEEMQSARIQYSRSDDANGRTRYCISQLLDTYYGRKIVWAAMGERAWDDPYDSIVVGDEVFMRMEQALRGLDLDIEGLLEVIDSNDWFKFVREVATQKARGMRSRELGLVMELAATTDQTLVENPASIERLAGAVESFRTSACNGRLEEYALSSSVNSIPIRIRCIGLLGRFGRNNDREVLAELLNDEDRFVREAAAVSLSRLESRLAWGVRPKGVPPRAAVDRKRLSSSLANIAKELSRLEEAKHKQVIVDTIQSLTNVPGITTGLILKGLMRHPSELVRVSILESSKNLGRDLAAAIVKAGLADESSTVVEVATKTMERRWGDDIWLTQGSGVDEIDIDGIEGF